MSRGPAQWSELAQLRAELAAQAAERAKRATAEALSRSAAERDARLFSEHVKDVTPLPASGRVTRPRAPVAPLARQRALDERAALRESLSDEFDAETLMHTDEALSWRRSGIGEDVLRRLRRGQWVIQDQLDLHGARRDEAREWLADFLRNALKRGLRCVRVVHGKGLGSIGGEPILKSRVRRWLTQKDEVLAFCQARAQDGGSGALVVLLRGARSP